MTAQYTGLPVSSRSVLSHTGFPGVGRLDTWQAGAHFCSLSLLHSFIHCADDDDDCRYHAGAGGLFDEYPLRVFGAAMSCCQVAVWLFVAGRTIRCGLSGSEMHSPCLSPPSQDKMSAAMLSLERQLSRIPTMANRSAGPILTGGGGGLRQQRSDSATSTGIMQHAHTQPQELSDLKLAA